MPNILNSLSNSINLSTLLTDVKLDNIDRINYYGIKVSIENNCSNKISLPNKNLNYQDVLSSLFSRCIDLIQSGELHVKMDLVDNNGRQSLKTTFQLHFSDTTINKDQFETSKIVEQHINNQLAPIEIKLNYKLIGSVIVYEMLIPVESVESQHFVYNPKQKYTINKKVLIVDDNMFNTVFIEDLLKSWGITVDKAEDGFEGIEFSVQTKYDIILMDIMMPYLDGYQATKQIRNNNENPNSKTKIYALSAKEVTDWKAYQMDGYLAKPVKPKTLFELITGANESKELAINNIFMRSFSFVDYQFLDEFLLGDSLVAADVFQSFLDLLPSMIQDFENAVKNNDYLGMAKVAHKCKPRFGMVGLNNIRDYLADIQHIKDEEDKGKLREIYRELRALIEKETKAVELELEHLRIQN